MSYTFLEKLMRMTANPDFFAGIPMQSAQYVLKDVLRDFKSWMAALAQYKKRPGEFLGKPQMTHYLKKKSVSTLTYSNQDCVIRFDEKTKKSFLKLPKIKLTLPIGYVPKEGRLMEVKVKPYYGNFILFCMFECKEEEKDFKEERPYACGIDFGVENTAALVSNNGSCVLYKGGAMKAANQ